MTRNQPQIPLFSRGISPSAKRHRDGPGSLNVPVICGGVIVYPGDIILGDMDGVVVLCPRSAARIVTQSQEHDTNARDASSKQVPYYDVKDSEAKMRAFDSVKWTSDPSS